MNTFSDGTLEISLMDVRAKINGRIINFSMQEFRLLALLSSHPKEVFSPNDLCCQFNLPIRNLHELIHRTRKKLGQKYIRTHYPGYSLC